MKRTDVYLYVQETLVSKQIGLPLNRKQDVTTICFFGKLDFQKHQPQIEDGFSEIFFGNLNIYCRGKQSLIKKLDPKN